MEPFQNQAPKEHSLPSGMEDSASAAPCTTPRQRFASWQDTARTIQSKTPALYELAAHDLTATQPSLPSLQCFVHVRDFLNNIGFPVPPWQKAAPAPNEPRQLGEPRDLTRGWQQAASSAIDKAYSAEITPSFDPASRAMLDSRAFRSNHLHHLAHIS